MIPLKGHKYIMDYYGRQKFGQSYSEQFRPYWLPNNQPGQLPVLVVQVPLPVRMENNCFDSDIKPTWIHRSKSRAQRNRDFKRRQTFLEKKSVCAIMPFYGLDGQDLTNAIQNSMDGLEVKLTSKLRKATQTIKNLEFENQSLAALNDKLGAIVTKEKQKSQELSTKLVAALEDKASSLKAMDPQEHRDMQKLIHTLKEDLKRYKQDYFDAEMRWSVEFEKVQTLEHELRQQEVMLDDMMKPPPPRHAVGPTNHCPYGYTNCCSPVKRTVPDTIAVRNKETPVLSSVFPVNNSKPKPRQKGRKKQS